MINRRQLLTTVGAIATTITIPNRDGKANPGDEQFQVRNEFGEFVECRFEDIVPGDLIRKSRDIKRIYRVDELKHDCIPPGFTVLPIESPIFAVG